MVYRIKYRTIHITPVTEALLTSVIFICVITLAQFSIWFSFFLFIPIYHILCLELKRSVKYLSAAICFFSHIIYCSSWMLSCYSIKESIVIYSMVCLTMLVPITVCFLVRNNKTVRCVLFGLAWLFVEYLMCHWSLGLPFYLVGYLLRFDIEFIQWYEYTGVLGGSLLILTASLVMYRAFSAKRKLLLMVLPILAIPFIFSHLNFNKTSDTTTLEKSVKIGIVQTAYSSNSLMNHTEICNQIKNILISDASADHLFYLFPEAILRGVYRLNYLDMSKDFLTLKRLNCSNIKSNLIIGAILYDTDVEDMSNRKYNSAVKINCDGYEIINKNKFIPVEERIPNFLGFMKGHIYSDDFESHSDVNQVFQIDGKKIGFLICYEALLGEYAAQSSKEVDLLAMMANESAFGNTIAVEQYLQVAQIRCIEQRKWMVKSSNMGYSAVIDDKGFIREKRITDKAINIFSVDVTCSNKKTFYAIHGDYTGRLSGILLLFFIGWILSKKMLINMRHTLFKKYLPHI